MAQAFGVVSSECGLSLLSTVYFLWNGGEAGGGSEGVLASEGGVKYLLINAEENVEVNGVNIHIGE